MKKLRGRSAEKVKKPQKPVKSKKIVKPKKTETKDIAKKRRRSRRKYLLYYILFFVLLLGAFCVLSLTVLFKIQKIVIESDAPYLESDILENIGTKVGDNLLRASQELAEENLAQKFPYVADVKFKRHLPDELVVKVKKEIPKVSSESEGRTVILSEKGKVLEILTSENNKGLPRVCGLNTDDLALGGYIKEEEKEKLNIVLNLQACLENEGVKADIIDVRDLSSIRILYDGRVDIYFGGTFEHDYKSAFVRTAIETSINDDFVGILDVSKRPTARLRPENIFLEENWLYPQYLLSDYEKTLTVKPNAIIPKEQTQSETIPDN